MTVKSYRTALRWLLGALVALACVWLALPRLIGLAAERWLAIPGIESLRVDVAGVDSHRLQLRDLRGTYRTQDGNRIAFTLADIGIDYSAIRRQIERIEAGHMELDLHPSPTATPSPWPQIALPTGLPPEVVIHDLQVALHRAPGTPWGVRGDFALRRSDAQWQAILRTAAGQLNASADVGETIDLKLDWRPESDSAANMQLRANRLLTAQPVEVHARLPLALAVELARLAGIEMPAGDARGEMAIDARALLGETSGSVRDLDGSVALGDAHARITLAATSAQAGRALDLSLDGKIRFAWQVQQATLELQPGLHWRVSDDAEPVEITGQLEKPYSIAHADGAIAGNGDLPVALRSPRWGAWDGNVTSLTLAGGAVPGEWRTAEARLRIQGLLPRWQHGQFAMRTLRASGELALNWSPADGYAGGFDGQLAPERLELSGETPFAVARSTWQLKATGRSAPAAAFPQGLTLQGEASSPPLRLDVGKGPERTIALGPIRLQLAHFGMTERGAARADLSLAADAIHVGTSWPTPDLRARIQLDGDRLRSDGRLLLGGEEALRFAASHALGRGCGKATLNTQDALADLGKRLHPRPAALAPLALAAGDATADLELDWCAAPVATFDAHGTLRLDNATLGWEKARAQGVTASLRLDGLNPPRGRVRLAVPRGELATGTELSDLDLDVTLNGPTLQVDTFNLNLLGGHLRSAPTALAWPPTETPWPLDIRQLDIGQLLDLFKISGLSGSGRLDGVLPLAYRDGALEIRDGHLWSTGGGTLKYAPSLEMPDNPGLQALRNLHFQSLDLRVNYASGGAYRTESVLEGSNPEFYDGYPVRFSLNINGELPGLFRSALFSGDFNRHILEQLQSGKLQ